MRDGDYKVLATLNDNKLPRYTNLSEDQFQKAKSAKLTDFELYDLASDPNEKNNLAKNNPAKLNEMKKKLNEGYFELLNDSHVWKK